MRIIRSTETIPVDHPVFLIFGQPGIGKTSLGYSCRAPLLRDYDKGAHRATNRRDTLVVESWADVVSSNDPAVLAPYASVVEDTVGRCLDFITADIAVTEPKKAPGGNLSLQGFGALKTRFRQHIITLRTQGKDILLIAHDKEDKDGDTRIVRPDITGGSYQEVLKVADFVGYLYMNGRDRMLDFNPSDRWIGKNPAGWAPVKVPPSAKAQDFMAELFDKGREALGNISDESAVIAAQVADWRTRVANMTAEKELNEAVPVVKKLTEPLHAQVVKLMVDRGTELKLTFDKKAGAFVPAPKVEQPVLVSA